MKKDKKLLGLTDLYTFAVGSTIGAGIVTLITRAAAVTGRSVWLAYVVAIIFGLGYTMPAFLASGIIKSRGGNYGLVGTVLGKKYTGVYCMAYLAATLTWGTYVVSFGTYFTSMVTGANPKLVSSLFLLTVFAINMLDLKFVSKVQNFITWLLIACLGLFVVAGLFQLKANPFDFSSPDFFTDGASGFFNAVIILVYSCYAYYMTFNLSGQTYRPRHNIPKAMLLCVLTLVVFYGLTAIVATHVLPLSESVGGTLTNVARAVLPGWFLWIFIFGGVEMAIMSTLNGVLASQSVLFAAAAQDGWYPKWLGATNKNGKPYVIFIIAAAISLILTWTNVSITTITNSIMFTKLFYDFVPVVAVFMLPKKFPEQFASSPLHLSKTTFYILLSIGFAIEVFCSAWSGRNIGMTAVIVSSIVLIICYVYGRSKGKDPNTRAPDAAEFYAAVDD